MPDFTGGVSEQERNDYWLTDPQSCSDAQPGCFPPKCMGDTGVLQKLGRTKLIMQSGGRRIVSSEDYLDGEIRSTYTKRRTKMIVKQTNVRMRPMIMIQ
jgi:hypothetical protein